MVQGKINRGRHTDHQAGRHSIRTNQCPSPPSPILCPSCRPIEQCQSTEGNEIQYSKYVISNPICIWRHCSNYAVFRITKKARITEPVAVITTMICLDLFMQSWSLISRWNYDNTYCASTKCYIIK